MGRLAISMHNAGLDPQPAVMLAKEVAPRYYNEHMTRTLAGQLLAAHAWPLALELLDAVGKDKRFEDGEHGRLFRRYAERVRGLQARPHKDQIDALVEEIKASSQENYITAYE